MIYKILSDSEWNEARTSGQFRGSAVDRKDGFIHFSSADQVRETAAKHFAGQHDLVLLGVDESSLGTDLKWEVSRNGELFPHLYADLAAGDVQCEFKLPLDNAGQHVFPKEL